MIGVRRVFDGKVGVRTGRVWMNSYARFPASAPFGSFKESDIGRETHKAIMEVDQRARNIIISLKDKPNGMYVSPNGEA